MFRYRPGIRHAHYLILQQSCLHYGISTPTLQIGSHFHPTSLIRRQWLSQYPPKSLGTMQEERGQQHPNPLDVYPSDREPTKSHSERKLGSRSIKLDTSSGDQELSQALERFKGNSKAMRQPKVEALAEARQVLRKLEKEQEKKRQLSDQSDSTQLGTGLNDSESSPPPESPPPEKEQKDSYNASKIKVQKINRALLKALNKLKSYPEWVDDQEKLNQQPLVRRIENYLPLVHKVVTGSSLPVSESQDSTAMKTAEQKHPPLVRKIVHESGIRHVIPGSISLSPEESHKSSSFNVSEDQARDLDNRELKISYEASKKLRIAFFPARDSSSPSFRHQETPNPEPLGSEQHPIPSIRRVEVEVKVDPDQPLIKYTGFDASSTDPPDQEDFKVYCPLRPGQDVYKEGVVRHFMAKKARPADLLPPPAPAPPIRDTVQDPYLANHKVSRARPADPLLPPPAPAPLIRDTVQNPHLANHKGFRARLSTSENIPFTKPQLGPIMSKKPGKELDSWQVKLLKNRQRKEAQALMKLEDGGLIRKCRTGDKSEEEHRRRRTEKRIEMRRMREERGEHLGAKDGMTKQERKEDRKARKKERRKLLKVQRKEKAAKKGMDYKEFIAKKTEQEIEKKKRKDKLKEQLKLEEHRRLEMERRLEELTGLEVRRRMVLKLKRKRGGYLARRIKLLASPKTRNVLMMRLRSEITARVRKELIRKNPELKPERDPDLDQQVREVFSPAKYQTLPRTIGLMVKKELKDKDEKPWELEIQRNPVFTNTLGSEDNPIIPEARYPPKRSRRYESFLKIAKDNEEIYAQAQATRTPPPFTPTSEDGIVHCRPTSDLVHKVSRARRIGSEPRGLVQRGPTSALVHEVSRARRIGVEPMGLVRRTRENHGSSGSGSRGLIPEWKVGPGWMVGFSRRWRRGVHKTVKKVYWLGAVRRVRGGDSD